MTRFFGHGQPIIHVFETERYIEHGEKCEMSIFSTLLDPISWALPIYLEATIQKKGF